MTTNGCHQGLMRVCSASAPLWKDYMVMPVLPLQQLLVLP